MTTQEFVFDLPLYNKVKISENHILEDLCEVVRLDGYNPARGNDSTYQLDNPIRIAYIKGESTISLRFSCLRYNDYLYVIVHFDEEKDYIEKVGQYPSVADIHIAQVKQYRKVLGESYIRDFTKAIGLAANGIGTGSFVYLRRVFEHLVGEMAKEAIGKGDIDREQFESSKMENKLRLLSGYLPDVVLENKSLYGVLSAGIHTLSEEECLSHFSVVRSVIELILDEKEHERLMMEKKKEARNKLASIVGEVKKATR